MADSETIMRIRLLIEQVWPEMIGEIAESNKTRAEQTEVLRNLQSEVAQMSDRVNALEAVALDNQARRELSVKKLAIYAAIATAIFTFGGVVVKVGGDIFASKSSEQVHETGRQKTTGSP